jgi:hypothetical protein
MAPGTMAYLLDNGNLLRGVRINDHPRFFGGGIAGRLQELDWDGKVVWDTTLANDARVLHHDVEVMPNGHLLAIVWEHVPFEGAVELGRDPAHTSPKGWWPDAVVELEPVRPDGVKLVWEWRALDHLVQDFDRSKKGFGPVADRPERIDVNFDHRDAPPLTAERRAEMEKREREMRELGYAGGDDEEASAPAKDGERKLEPDWMHTNGIDYHPRFDLIVLSSPRLDEIWVIDHSTTTEEARGTRGGRYGKGGELLYRWGNPANYGVAERSEQRLFGQHDPQWVAGASPDELRVTLFNNGVERPGAKYSSVEELVLPFDPARGFLREKGVAFGPDEPAWIYTAPERESFYSFFISGAQRLPNGNTLVCSGAQGRFFELSPDQRIVWEFWNPHGGEIPHSIGKAGGERKSPVEPKAVFQATRIAPDHPALASRALKPEETGQLGY